MKDRFTRGFLSGVIAGIPSIFFAIIAQHLKWTNLRWAHFASILIYGRKYLTLPENIFSSFSVFFFCGLAGAIFASLVKNSKLNLLFKSWVYSVAIWFIAFAVTFLFKVPQLLLIPLHTAFSNFIQATIWGFSLGYCLSWFDNKTKTDLK